jgi:hypothetical protein
MRPVLPCGEIVLGGQMSNTFKEVLAALEADPALARAVADAPEAERASLLADAGVTVPSKEEQDEYLREHPDALKKIKVEGESQKPICSVVA